MPSAQLKTLTVCPKAQEGTNGKYLQGLINIYPVITCCITAHSSL